MDIRDFQGLFKYKIILPVAALSSLVCAFIGPFLFPHAYELFMLVILSFGLIKATMQFVSMVLVCYFMHRGTLARANKSELEVEEQKNFLVPENPLLYAFVIPNYKQEMLVLQNTIQMLASHSRAHSYCIFLGMENHQKNSDAKAAELIQKYQSKFHLIYANYHTVKQHEQKGKSSNVSSVVQNIEPVLKKFNVDPVNLFFTIIDADTLIPPLYIDLIEENILKKYEERHRKIFVPPQIFCNNQHESSSMVRAMDNVNCIVHMGQFHNPYGLTMAFSNYSMSYELIKRIGYWDTCADAIGQDYHNVQKASWKTEFDVITENIYCSTNQMNIITGKGSWQDFKARFWQCERHCQGCASFAYSMKQFLQSNKSLNGFKLILFLIDIYLLGLVLPWINISLLFQNIAGKFLQLPERQYDMTWIIVFSVIFCLMPLFILHYYKYTTIKYIYKQEPKLSFITVVEANVLFILLLLTIIVPSFFVASLMIMKPDRQYIVAEKKLGKQSNNAISI